MIQDSFVFGPDPIKDEAPPDGRTMIERFGVGPLQFRCAGCAFCVRTQERTWACSVQGIGWPHNMNNPACGRWRSTQDSFWASRGCRSPWQDIYDEIAARKTD